jgi:hypothetical protein
VPEPAGAKDAELFAAFTPRLQAQLPKLPPRQLAVLVGTYMLSGNDEVWLHAGGMPRAGAHVSLQRSAPGHCGLLALPRGFL